MNSDNRQSLLPGDTIGIIGGGQLGRMLAIAAARLGFHTVILDPGKDCPASQTANQQIVAAYDDVAALKRLAEVSKVITYEFENISAEAMSFLEENTLFCPNRSALEKSQDRLVEKQFLNELGIATAPFFDIASAAGLASRMLTLKTPAILKTRRFGYDGKGQARLVANPDASEIDMAWEAVGQTSSVLEGFIDFQREISIIIARTSLGQTAFFDPAENVHREGILRTSTLPADITSETAEEAARIARLIVEALDYVGTMGVEFFVTSDGGLIVNEIAPRVHNSGHWTEAACAVSQFEQHIRAVAGLPLGDPTRHSDCVMENLIGNDMERLPDLLLEKGLKIHLYGKSDTRPGRKMGHFTRFTQSGRQKS
jgi:5-(carboxyamino)imidazole ribonucleotide synthase